jgi:tetratricopeptide (TPR) repeat protein
MTAMVLEIKGQVSLQPAKGKARPLQEGDLLYPGDRLTAADEGQATLYFRAGNRRERLKPKQQATVGEGGCNPATAVEELKKVGAEKKAIVDGLNEVDAHSSGTTTVFRGAPKDKKPAVTPIDHSRVLSDQPVLLWPAVPKAKSYKVEMMLQSTGRVIWRADSEMPRLVYPAKEKSLRRDREYLWRALWVAEDGEIKQCANAGFYVVPAEVVAEMEKLRNLATGNDPADLFLVALTYDAQEFYGEALEVYEKLCKLVPKKAVFHAARAVLYERAGRGEDARKARAEAEKLTKTETPKDSKGP